MLKQRYIHKIYIETHVHTHVYTHTNSQTSTHACRNKEEHTQLFSNTKKGTDKHKYIPFPLYAEEHNRTKT